MAQLRADVTNRTASQTGSNGRWKIRSCAMTRSRTMTGDLSGGGVRFVEGGDENVTTSSFPQHQRGARQAPSLRRSRSISVSPVGGPASLPPHVRLKEGKKVGSASSRRARTSRKRSVGRIPCLTQLPQRATSSLSLRLASSVLAARRCSTALPPSLTSFHQMRFGKPCLGR